MDILCYFCQGTFTITLKDIEKIDEEFHIAICPACGAENEVFDVDEWFSPDELREDLTDEELIELYRRGVR